MQKTYFALVVLLLTVSTVSSQNYYSKGYYINAGGDRVEGLIKNNDWKNNPTSFSFKSDTEAAPVEKTINLVKLFEIYNAVKYEAYDVKIDKSSSQTNALSTKRQPEFIAQRLFLKELIKGPASLYYYEEANLKRFFFKTQKEDMTQLVFKKYLTSNGKIAKNLSYQYQLQVTLECDDKNFRKTNSIAYTSKDLIQFFNDYNKCVDNSFEVKDTGSVEKRNSINFTIKPGVNSVSFETKNSLTDSRDIDKSSGIGYRIGAEIETILPFNNNKWSLFLEPTYQSFTNENNDGNRKTGVSYKAFELALGGRHYLFLNDSMKLFINAGFNLNIPLGDSFVQFTEAVKRDVNGTSNLTLGLGAKWNEKLSGELRVHTNRNIQADFINSTTQFQMIEFIVGYTVF